MERKKIISVRVNEDLYNKFQSIVAEHTKTYQCYKTRRIYDFRDSLLPNRYQYRKFSLGDLLEIALKEFVKEREEKESSIEEK